MEENEDSFAEACTPFVLYVCGEQQGNVYSPSPVDMQIAAFCSVKADCNNVDYKIIPTTKACPSESFKLLNVQLMFPTFANKFKTYQNIEDIIHYFNFHFENPDLSYDRNCKAADITKNLLINFCHYIKNYPNDQLTKLTSIFKKIEVILMEDGQKYLISDHLTLLDLNILCKLYHIVVCMKMFLDIKILNDLPYVSRYLTDGFSQKIISRVCPSNNGIFYFWKDKVSQDLVNKNVTRKFINDVGKMYETGEYLP